MKNIFFLTITDNTIIEGELIENNTSPLKCIKTKNGFMYVPKTSIWPTKNELMINEFVNLYSILGFDNMCVRYGLEKEECKKYLELTMDKFPEKFI